MLRSNFARVMFMNDYIFLFLMKIGLMWCDNNHQIVLNAICFTTKTADRKRHPRLINWRSALLEIAS